MPLDALVTGGRVATLGGDHGFGWVEAVGVRDGRVAFAGSAVELETRADPHTIRIELEPGEIAIPGLIDAHLHLIEAAIAAERVDLGAAARLTDGLAAVADAHAALPPGAWLLGAGWDQRRWGRWPTADDLATAAPGRPAALWSFDHHAVWASREALAIAGVHASSPDPDGGVVRRLADGSPEGVLLENAASLVTSRIPGPGEAELRRLVAATARRLVALGVVGIHDPGTFHGESVLGGLDLYEAMADDGELPVRVHAGLRAEALEPAAERGLRSGDPLGPGPDGRARVGWLKLFADGTLGSQTAALLEPRAGSDDRGLFLTQPGELGVLAQRAAEAGIATQVHAIGDAAVRAALDALEPTTGRVRLMPRVEHAQLVHADDLGRFATAGIAASVQPVHLREDATTARRDWGERAEKNGYPWRSLFESGAILAFGTDAPVEPIDPWPGIAMAVLRHDPGWGVDAPAFAPDEALTLEQALRAATIGPSVTAREPDRGRLVPGARADFIVLPASPREVAEDASRGFADVRPRLVMIDGDIAFEA